MFIGLMSGTSLDGIDGVLATFGPGGTAPMQVLAHCRHAFDPALRAELLALNTPGADELSRAALAANALARACASVAAELVAAAAVPRSAVQAIGAHGQTVRHRPGPGTAYTIQLLNGALLAELCGIDVVCDFRSRDVAAGGQGAPLVPAFHAACFGKPGRDLAVLNLGGIANLSLLFADGRVLGFDTGPANVLIDLWAERTTGQAFDADGALAARGRVDPGLLARLRAEPFFALPPPKSTGRDLFHAGWLDTVLGSNPGSAADVAATLTELTACTVADALLLHAPRVGELVVCGGGANNRQLLARLAARLSGVVVQPSSAVGVPPDQVEALAFAWLAAAFTARRPGNLPAVTGAGGPRVLGALYPAGGA